jgi:hypothetical protein
MGFDELLSNDLDALKHSSIRLRLEQIFSIFSSRKILGCIAKSQFYTSRNAVDIS